ncbi:MAG: UbiH/UbiF/VisC/COQ6 family ubiquinone biosynthesis hydroxylase [Paracoccaceae bacterium]|nr:MAG: UbiH/UbiF/VisC/COQ6 family ubiquinone biosynthesis hydroxylase [Paracoccaceae bacterium]
MEHDADILIVGGGLNGPALALALAHAGLTSAIVDARPAQMRRERGFDGRAYALAAASQRLLSALGVWPLVADHAQPILQVKASDGRAGEGAAPFFLHFDAAELDDGQMGAMLEDRFLHGALMDRVAATPGIARHPGQTVTAQEVTARGASVTLASGTRVSGRLIVGCDGRGSGTATRAGLRRRGWAYGQTALVTAIEHDLPHHGIAHQFFMPEGPLAILPLPGNMSSLVWSETDARAAAIQALPDDAYLAAVRPRVGEFLGALRLAGDRFTYPLSLSLAERWVAPRVVLVGDAAHGVHPIAGQGLNLGLRDVAALAETLVEAQRRGEDIAAPDVLDRYQRWRRFDTTALALGMDAVNRLFSNDNPILRPLRDIGMGLVSATPVLRRAFMRQAAGLSGDLPRLLRGQPL